MTKLISLRVIIAVDDTVDLKDLKPRLASIISAKGTEFLGENGDGSRIHWSTVDVLQGPERGVRTRLGGKAATRGQGDMTV